MLYMGVEAYRSAVCSTLVGSLADAHSVLLSLRLLSHLR